MHSTFRTVSLAALAAVLLGGCGGGSVTPGQGASGGLGTPGTGTGNPDATLVFRLRGSSIGDFEATDVKATVNVLGFQVQGSASSGPATGRVLRVTTVRFNGLPVANHDYVVGGTDVDGVVMQYNEKDQQTSVTKVWNGSSGTIHVSRVSSDHVDATFNATLDPAQNAQTSVTASGGEIHVKYQ
ncbi:MAG TPA: hypothetical protein VGM51_03210 [Armatimonadota bacterium]|jgi:hypothetical protein